MRYTSFSKTERLMEVFACLFLFFLASCETDTYLFRPQSSYYYVIIMAMPPREG